MEFYKITLKQFIDDMRKDSVLYFGRTLTLLGYYISSQIFIEILEAVDYMHKHNKFLGNLKPNNILLKKVSDGRTVRIADFYTRFIRDLADESKLRFKSSLKYFAPEYLADDLQEFDAKADVFSLGVIFQELLDINVNRY
jgi:serine/threonine protein kinase